MTEDDQAVVRNAILRIPRKDIIQETDEFILADMGDADKFIWGY